MGAARQRSGAHIGPRPAGVSRSTLLPDVTDCITLLYAVAFAANNPLPIGAPGAIGYGVNEMYGPQINQATGQVNTR